jgi:hypothetical protein
VLAFADNHTNVYLADNTLTQACDLFSYVNEHWKYNENYTGPRMASEIAGSLEGTQKDYTILMSALLQSIHAESRVIYSFNGDLVRYYPEVFIGNTSASYTVAVQSLNARYGGTSPKGHSDDTGYWISLGMGSVPGIRPANATLEYALQDGQISPIDIA